MSYFLKVDIDFITCDLKDSEFRLLLLMMIRSFRTHIYWGSKQDLAKQMNVTVRTIERCLNGLEEKGMITKEKKETKTGKTKRNKYIIKDELYGNFPSEKEAKSAVF